MRTIPFQFRHGGYIKQETVQSAVAKANVQTIDVETAFDYLFPDLANDPGSLLPTDNAAAVISNLKALGKAMIEAQNDPAEANSIIPPIYTYWGQFLDHDITANTDRSAENLQTDITKDTFTPLLPDFITANLKNLRRPTFDLDSIYGDGPTFDPSNPTEAKDFYQEDDLVKLKVGQNVEQDANGNTPPGVKIPPEEDLMRDLPRNNRIAMIGDSRNDENLIIAQFHTAFLRFHNAVVDWVRTHEPDNAKNHKDLFLRARNLVCWHYQWLVVNDFLKTLTISGTVERILNNGLQFYAPRDGQLFMPLEFSVASYRFGHSMVRSVYDFNRNFTFTDEHPDAITEATFELLFSFTGRGNIGERQGPGAHETLPFNWIIEWDRFIDKERAAERGRGSARKIDTHLAPPLTTLINEGEDAELPMSIKELLKHLAQRNLLRGYLLSIPTGQSLADRLGIAKLTTEELQQSNSEAMNLALEPFLERTPTWFYVLKESEVRTNGDSLGEVGSRIVAETFLGLMMNDENSYLNQRDYDGSSWRPSKGVKLPDGGEILEIADFLKFAEVLP